MYDVSLLNTNAFRNPAKTITIYGTRYNFTLSIGANDVNFLLQKQTYSLQSGVPRSRTRHNRELYAFVHFAQSFYLLKSKVILLPPIKMITSQHESGFQKYEDTNMNGWARQNSDRYAKWYYHSIWPLIWYDKYGSRGAKLSDCTAKWDNTEVSAVWRISMDIFPSLSANISKLYRLMFFIHAIWSNFIRLNNTEWRITTENSYTGSS